MKRRNNRTAGHSYELKVRNALLFLFPHLATSRSCNRARDGQKVDLVNEDESEHGRLPYNIQCKKALKVKYHEVLGEMPGNKGIINVIFHSLVTKRKVLFVEVGEYAVCEASDFIKLMAQGELAKAAWKQLTEEQKQQVLAALHSDHKNLFKDDNWFN
jgi:hypothetical protein